MDKTPKQSESITIRKIFLEDARLLLNLRLEALQDTPEAYGEDYESVLSQPYSIWEDLVSHSLGDGNRVFIVAEVEGQLVGMAGVNRSSMKNTRHSASLWGVYVQPGWRGKGVATDLVRHCIDWGRGEGLGHHAPGRHHRQPCSHPLLREVRLS